MNPVPMSLTHAGLERSYLLYVPATYDRSKPTPLLIVLHGRGIEANFMVTMTGGGFNNLADQHGFILVYPNAINEVWNDGHTSPEMHSNADDVGFIRALIEHLAAEYTLDRSRIYLTGLSNGGGMAFRLGSELSDQIAAIAPVAALMRDHMARLATEGRTPSRPVAVLIITGTRDPLVPYNGGEARRLWLRWLRRHGTNFLSAEETARWWAQVNGCTGEPTVTLRPEVEPRDGTRIRETRYEGGRAPVVLLTVENGGHTWPGGLQYMPAFVIGKASRQIDACRVIWGVFQPIQKA